MLLTRRHALASLAGASATLILPQPARAAAERVFRIERSGSNIGTHRIAVSREGELTRVAIDIDIVVRVLGIPAYRYEMTNRETWRDGELVSIDSRVNDDGAAKRVVASRNGAKVAITSEFVDKQVSPLVATTTYVTPLFLDRPDWVSTDSGELLGVSATELGPDRAGGGVASTAWRASDGNGYDVVIHYDDRGEWVGLAFDAGGREAIYIADSVDDRLAEVWAG
ncbi:MAG: hypothetical protein EA355_06560 [Rhodobacteraceae bacterium]|nr:MAG: hypothetical protein EA355_06560 [Paracoccaceae bacterium]